MTDKAIPKKKTGRPKAPPAPPALGIAERRGDGWKFTIVLGGLVVNGKKWEPQMAAELLAGMLEDGMKRIARPAASQEPSPEPASAAAIAESSEPDHTATTGDGDVPTAESGDARATPEPAIEPGENGHH